MAAGRHAHHHAQQQTHSTKLRGGGQGRLSPPGWPEPSKLGVRVRGGVPRVRRGDSRDILPPQPAWLRAHGMSVCVCSLVRACAHVRAGEGARLGPSAPLLHFAPALCTWGTVSLRQIARAALHALNYPPLPPVASCHAARRDVEASSRFYRNLLGFQQVRRPKSFEFDGCWWVWGLRVCARTRGWTWG